MSIDLGRYHVRPGAAFRLDDIDPDDTKREGFPPRDVIDTGRTADLAEIRELHERLFAEKRHALLIVMMAIDTGGKDSTTERIFSGLNPQGCRVTSFGVPTPEEQAHDFLWRIHDHVPPKGIIGIFNRSQYEDVTVQRVHKLIDDRTRERRYGHIRDFERMLAETGTTLLKFHLRISKDEQAERLNDRLEDPTKHWKFDPNDLAERKRWDDYQHAFEDAITATTADYAPWYVVPANRKWYRDAVVARAIVEALRELNPQYPPPVKDLETYSVE
jgi:PPK2 family polyphosphate:nucleotide phosphotransferase